MIGKLLNLKFFFSLFLLLLFLYPDSSLAASCNGLRVEAGDERDRCYQASSDLSRLISCLEDTNPSLIITSIGDDPDFFSSCVTNWSQPPCSHHRSSDHYGGSLVDGGRACVNSHALDLRAANATQAAPIINQVIACGGRAVFESGPGAPHVHASVGNCGGSTGATTSILGVTKKIEPICFRPAFPIPGFSVNDENADCDNGLILSSKGDAIIVYINALYKYGAGLAGLMAMFMIVFAAWQWIMASGNAGKIDNAKETIRGSLLGLTLLFAGNLLLSNITNRLVSFNGLNINNIITEQEKEEVVVKCSVLAEAGCRNNSSCVWSMSDGLCYSSSDDLCSAHASEYTCGESFVKDEKSCAGGLRCSTPDQTCGYRPGGNSNMPIIPCTYLDIKNGKECSCASS